MTPITKMLLDFREKGNRPGVKIKPDMLIIHRTGNPGASALANRNYFNSEKDDKTYASAHYCVDSKQIIQCLPEDEMGYHVVGQNKHTIGIELCEPLTAQAYENFIDLVVDIVTRHGWSWTSDYIRPHSCYDPKNRPHDPFSWSHFKETDQKHPQDLIDGRKFYDDVKTRLESLK